MQHVLYIYKAAGIYLFKVNNRKSSTIQEICSNAAEVILASLLLTLDRFHTLFSCLDYWLWISKCRLDGFYIANSYIVLSFNLIELC